MTVVVSRHYLRRRAERRRGDIARWQTAVKGGGQFTYVERREAEARLAKFEVGVETRLEIIKHGKYDARYLLVVRED